MVAKLEFIRLSVLLASALSLGIVFLIKDRKAGG